MNGAESRRLRAVALLATAFVATVMTVADVAWSGRILVSVAFFVLVPGCAAVSYRGLDDPLTEVTLGMATSIAIGTGVAMAMLAVDAWEPEIAQVALAAASAPRLVRQLRRDDEGAPR